EALFLDVHELVEFPFWPFVALDHERAEGDGSSLVRMVDRAARLPIHPGNLAVLVLIVRDDLREVFGRQLLVELRHHGRSQRIEDLALIEPVLAVVANLGDSVGEMIQHDAFDALSLGARNVRLTDSCADRALDGIEEDLKVRRLAVRGDRHVRRDDIEPDVEVLILRRCRDGMPEAAPEHVDIALVPRGADPGGDRGAIDADLQGRSLVLWRGPRLNEIGNMGHVSLEGRTALAGVFVAVPRADADQAARFYLLGVLPGDAQERIRLLAGDRLADCAPEFRLSHDLTRLGARAAVEVGDELAHRPRAAGIEQLMKLRLVVPPRRTLARVGHASERDRGTRPGELVRVIGEFLAEADLNAGADRKVYRLDADDRGRSIALGA